MARKSTSPVPASVAPRAAEEFWRVEKTVRVPSEMSSYYTLPAGKVISSVGYDIARLRDLGVELHLAAGPASSRPAVEA